MQIEADFGSLEIDEEPKGIEILPAHPGYLQSLPSQLLMNTSLLLLLENESKQK